MKLLLGEMAEGLLLSGQRAIPAKAETLGFKFTYPQLESALSDLLEANHESTRQPRGQILICPREPHCRDGGQV